MKGIGDGRGNVDTSCTASRRAGSLGQSSTHSSTNDPPPLRLITANCGGAAEKLPRLVALLMYTDPDVVCLQEAGGLRRDQLDGLPFHSFHSPPIRSGGLITLVHRRLPAGHHSVRVILSLDHALATSIQLTPSTCLSIANLHLPPSLPAATRRSTCADVAALLLLQPPGARIIAGDLNTDLDASSTWLRGATSADGCWSGWSCPYHSRAPTNMVRVGPRLSAKVLDWVLVSPDTVCTAASATALPGLSTHAALQVDLSLSALALRPLDPCGRRLRYRLASPAQLARAAHIAALVAWWSTALGRSADDTIRLIHSHAGPPSPWA